MADSKRLPTLLGLASHAAGQLAIGTHGIFFRCDEYDIKLAKVLDVRLSKPSSLPLLLVVLLTILRPFASVSVFILESALGGKLASITNLYELDWVLVEGIAGNGDVYRHFFFDAREKGLRGSFTKNKELYKDLRQTLV